MNDPIRELAIALTEYTRTRMDEIGIGLLDDWAARYASAEPVPLVQLDTMVAGHRIQVVRTPAGAYQLLVNGKPQAVE